MKKKKIICPCGQSKFGRCPNCSKVKMWIGLKSQYKHIKLDDNSPVRYNYIKYNNYPFHQIVEGMKTRILPSFYGKYNKVIFFDRQTGNAPITITP